jgi:hypothetical protein
MGCDAGWRREVGELTTVANALEWSKKVKWRELIAERDGAKR